MRAVGKHERVAVAVSGGVDSSVAAYLLQKSGISVCGVFITIRAPGHVVCSSAEDRVDAMRACAALGIPFMEFDATDLYRRAVIEPFVAAYRRGETPNPDVLCNTFVKFDALYQFIREKGFAYLATGHYARAGEIDGRVRLLRSVDEEKDQTYFIHTMRQEVLERVLFPVGEHTKSEVRAIARRAALPAAGKRDSVGLCFLGAVSMKEFLSAYIAPREGEVRLVGDDAKVCDTAVGTHDGVWFYTLGQRHGFTVSDSSRGPYVVVGKDGKRNVLFVSRSEDVRRDAGQREFRIVDVVFREPPVGDVFARYRHRGGVLPVSVRKDEAVGDGGLIVSFERPQVISPGQSIVLYTRGGVCPGGGVVSG